MALDREITVVFDEGVGGFPTFQTYVPESGLSINNRFFSFASGTIWEHHNNDVARGRFYAGSPNDAIIQVIFNDAPSNVKNFKTIGYEGDGNWDVTITTDQESTVTDSTAIPPIRTISGSIEADEFVTRKGKHFGYIRGISKGLSNLDLESINVQGLGTGTVSGDTVTVGEIPADLQAAGVDDAGLPFIGDSVFFFRAAGSSFDNDLNLAGTVLSIDNNTITLQPNIDPVALNPGEGDFYLFTKDNVVESSGVIGFYGIVEFRSSDSSMVELFSINTEAFVNQN